MSASIETPSYCQYSSGPCDQSFAGIAATDVYFFYSSRPEVIASTIEEGAELLRGRESSWAIKTWRDMPVNGQLIFCQVCKAQRFTRVAVVDVTTMNFNLMFEIGYALGLGIPVVPIRDTTYTLDTQEFESLGLIDTLGYLDFQNSEELAAKLPAAVKNASIPIAATFAPNREQPCYLLKSPIVTNGLVKVISAVKKSGLRFRTYDPKEQPRLSLQDAFRQVKTSIGVSVYHCHHSGQAQLCTMPVVRLLRGWQWRQVLTYSHFRKVIILNSPLIIATWSNITRTARRFST